MKYRIVRYKSGRYGLQHKGLFGWKDEPDAFLKYHFRSFISFEEASHFLQRKIEESVAWKVDKVMEVPPTEDLPCEECQCKAICAARVLKQGLKRGRE